MTRTTKVQNSKGEKTQLVPSASSEDFNLRGKVTLCDKSLYKRRLPIIFFKNNFKVDMFNRLASCSTFTTDIDFNCRHVSVFLTEYITLSWMRMKHLKPSWCLPKVLLSPTAWMNCRHPSSDFTFFLFSYW